MVATDASIRKCNDCRSTVSRNCDIVTRDPHELVNEIIILPNAVRHAPSRNAKQEIVALRPIFPLSPDLPPLSTSEFEMDRPCSVSHDASGRFHGASRSRAHSLVGRTAGAWAIDFQSLDRRQRRPEAHLPLFGRAALH